MKFKYSKIKVEVSHPGPFSQINILNYKLTQKSAKEQQKEKVKVDPNTSICDVDVYPLKISFESETVATTLVFFSWILSYRIFLIFLLLISDLQGSLLRKHAVAGFQSPSLWSLKLNRSVSNLFIKGLHCSPQARNSSKNRFMIKFTS